MGKDSKIGVEGVYLVAAFFILLCLAFCDDARAGVEIEVGPTFLSGEWSEGGVLLISETFENKFMVGAGYMSKQYCHCTWPTEVRENIFIFGARKVRYKKVDLSIGMAYFQNTNRALGKNLTFGLSLGYTFNKHWFINARHWSNAGSGSPNLGQDALTIGYSF